MNNWVEALATLLTEGRAVAVVTVIGAKGSTPREAGAKMLVTAQGRATGTIGGGALEALALADAQGALAEGGPRLRRYVLCAAAGQCCGGEVEVFIEVLNAGPRLYLFGAGHVGQALCRVLQGTDFGIHLVDPRPEWLQAPGLPEGIRRHGGDWRDFVAEAEWSPRIYVAVMTHSHPLDYDLVAELSGREAAFLGLIGSKAKAARFKGRLREAGLPPERIARVQCPIGLDIGRAKAPQEVAISVAAQLLRLQRGGGGR